MKMKKRILSAHLFLSILTLSMSVPTSMLAQTKTSPGEIYIPYSMDFVREKIASNTESSGRYGKRIIPDGIYLEAMFRKALSDRNFLISATPTDWMLINNLPSKNDERFLSIDIAELLQICADFSNDAFNDISEAAEAFDASRKRSELSLSNHYVSVFKKLSATSQKLIADGRIELERANQISYSKLNLSGIAADIPEVAIAMLEKHCLAIGDISRAYMPERKTLREDLPILEAMQTTNYSN